MAQVGGSVRQRKAKATEDKSVPVVEELTSSEPEGNSSEEEDTIEQPKRTNKERVESEDDYSPWLDILRVLSFLIFASCALSYLISSGETFTWGMRHPPKYLQADWWKSQVVSCSSIAP